MFDKLAIALGIYIVVPWIYESLKMFYLHFAQSKKDLKKRYGQGSYCLIAGSTSGIGKELAQEFAKMGFNLILIGKSKEKLEALKASLNYTIGIKLVVCDFRDRGIQEILP